MRHNSGPGCPCGAVNTQGRGQPIGGRSLCPKIPKSALAVKPKNPSPNSTCRLRPQTVAIPGVSRAITHGGKSENAPQGWQGMTSGSLTMMANCAPYAVSASHCLTSIKTRPVSMALTRTANNAPVFGGRLTARPTRRSTDCGLPDIITTAAGNGGADGWKRIETQYADTGANLTTITVRGTARE